MPLPTIANYQYEAKDSSLTLTLNLNTAISGEMHMDASVLTDIGDLLEKIREIAQVINVIMKGSYSGIWQKNDGSPTNEAKLNTITIERGTVKLTFSNLNPEKLVTFLSKLNLKEQDKVDKDISRPSTGGHMPLRINVAKEIFAANPDFAMGIVRARVKVAKRSEELWKLMQACCEAVRTDEKYKSVTEVAQIKAVRATYKSLGKNPGEFQGSNEALVRRALKGQELYQINTVVDSNNVVSVEACRSIGSYDVSKLGADIVFRPGAAGEKYPSTKKRSIDLKNLPLLADESGPFGSPTSDSERSLITEETQEIISTIFSFDGPEGLDDQVKRLASLFSLYAEASMIETQVLTQRRPNCELRSAGAVAGAEVSDSSVARGGAGGASAYHAASPFLDEATVTAGAHLKAEEATP
ncbi:MAG: hypothetical protein K0R66_1147 [Gammaproteobacteria bacterium]|jgi:DNA/RNA-binding domain of Phe-tRNA-synthetase-like protein|nr:hypothetical protein [Gammaproteobacteria bacterium]